MRPLKTALLVTRTHSLRSGVLRDIAYMRQSGLEPFAILAHRKPFALLVRKGVIEGSDPRWCGLPVVICPSLNDDALCAVDHDAYLRLME